MLQTETSISYLQLVTSTPWQPQDLTQQLALKELFSVQSRNFFTPASALHALRIPLVLDLPHMWRHLHDHLGVSLYWKSKEQGNGVKVSPRFRHYTAVPSTARSEGADEMSVRHSRHNE